MVMALCQRFHCLPSQALAEDASVFRMIRLVDMAHPQEG